MSNVSFRFWNKTWGPPCFRRFFNTAAGTPGNKADGAAPSGAKALHCRSMHPGRVCRTHCDVAWPVVNFQGPELRRKVKSTAIFLPKLPLGVVPQVQAFSFFAPRRSDQPSANLTYAMLLIAACDRQIWATAIFNHFSAISGHLPTR
jgi:hypothetical protein